VRPVIVNVGVCYGRTVARPQLIHAASRLHSAKGELEPVCAFIAQQDEVNHRCEKEQEYALSHEYAAWVEYQPDLVELCHVLFLSYQLNQGSLMYVST
jgi:hypothetical protein